MRLSEKIHIMNVNHQVNIFAGRIHTRVWRCVMWGLLVALPLPAQVATTEQQPVLPAEQQPVLPTEQQSVLPTEQQPQPDQRTPAQRPGRRLAGYVLGPGDELVIMSVHAPEIANKPIAITNSGDFTVPMIGRIEAAGKTLEQLQTEVEERLKTYIKEPDVAINVSKMRSQPVSVFGAVGAPGVHQLEGNKTLIEVLSMAGGVRPDSGSRVKITRNLEWGSIPLPGAATSGAYSVAEVDIRSIENATHPEQNVQVLPYDVITVPRAELVYVIGEGVRQPGAFALNDRKGISVIEAFARAQGQAQSAGLKNARIVRPVPDASRIEIAVNLDEVLKGKTKDIILQAGDILYVPRSEIKGTARRTLDTLVQMTTGLLIYRF